MITLLNNLAASLAASVVLGLLCGAAIRTAHPMPAAGRVALGIAAALVLAGGVVSSLGLLPGRSGLVLDISVLLVAGYGSGCGFGCAARRLLARGRAPA